MLHFDADQGNRMNPSAVGFRSLAWRLLAAALAWLPLQHALAAEAHPPGQTELTIPSHGAKLNGFLYTAAGAGPHPLAVFLHGFPGNERNLDLAQAVRRAGWDALYFDYRGNWGSGGRFSFANALEDVAAALAYMRVPANAAKYRLDPQRIALIGHSMGGGLALLTAARDPGVRCTVALAAWNFGGEGKQISSDPGRKHEQLGEFRAYTDADSGPLRAKAEDLQTELIAHAQAWDFVAQAGTLKDRPLLVVADTGTPGDLATYKAFTAALEQAGARHLRALTYADDHPFSAHREELATLLTGWLGSDCPAAP